MLQRTEAVIPQTKNSASQALRGLAAIGVVFAHAYGRSTLPFEFPRYPLFLFDTAIAWVWNSRRHWIERTAPALWL
jgi:hypothetical protein